MKLSDIITEKVNVTQAKNAREAEYLQKAADFLINHLGLNGKEIVLSLNPPSSIVTFDGAQTGMTIGMGRKPNKIFIMLDNKLSTGEKVKALAHEMVHAIQLASGRLTILDIKDSKVRGEWEGEKFTNMKYQRNNPWEIEAHSREDELHRLVIDELGNFTR